VTHALARLATLSLLSLGASATAVAAAATDEAVTFNRDVAPIFYARCVTCHRPGEVAPMSLLDHASARPWAKSIARVVQARDMPPWSAESDHRSWSNDMSLSGEEVATIVRWVAQGAPAGDPADLPPAPASPTRGRWASPTT
jgi:hypothetical protein